MNTCLPVRLSNCVCLSVCLTVSACLSVYSFLSVSLSIYPSVHLSIYLSIYWDINLFKFTYMVIQLNDMIVIHLKCYSKMIDNVTYWSKILSQKTLLNQRERICCLNLNWWNNLNLILTLSNSWDALLSLVSTEMSITSYGYSPKN